jgi:hypothetical protein
MQGSDRLAIRRDGIALVLAILDQCICAKINLNGTCRLKPVLKLGNSIHVSTPLDDVG